MNNNLHHRRSIRLKGYDYAQAGMYFITICCGDRVCRFGHIEHDEMVLNENGKIAHDQWIALTERFQNCELDAFQIMPNHMHGIIVLKTAVTTRPVGATLAVAPTNVAVAPTNVAVAPTNVAVAPTNVAVARTTISDIIGAYKSLVANECLKIFKSKNEIMGALWQRDYYEHIIRDDGAYQRITHYIENNSRNWNADILKNNTI